MVQDKDFKSRSKKRKREEGKSPFLKGCQAGFSGLPSHLSGLGTGIESCWLAPPMSRLSVKYKWRITALTAQYCIIRMTCNFVNFYIHSDCSHTF